MYKDKRSTRVPRALGGGPADHDHIALVLLRGGGDLASGVALRLHRAGIKLVITELAQPLAVRRTVSFAEAIFAGQHTIEGVTGRLVKPEEVPAVLEGNEIPILVDPDANILTQYEFPIVIDARLLKTSPHPLPVKVPLHIGLGPGFHAGVNCDAAIETRRSHTLGRVYWNGATQSDSGQPEGDQRRVLRAPTDGILSAITKIGEHVEEGQVIAVIHPDVILSPSTEFRINSAKNLSAHPEDSSPTTQSAMKIVSPFRGVLRGLIHDGIPLKKGVKIGDIDPRDDPSACFLVSDKALTIGGAVLEAILTRAEIREKLWK